MKKIKLIIAIHCFICLTGIHAQSITPSVINTCGQELNNAGTTLIFTLGELSVTDVGNSNISVSTGTLSNMESMFFSDIAYTVADGYWNDPFVWNNKMIPTQNSILFIGHAILVSLKATCSALKVKNPGTVTIEPGVNLEIKKR